MWRWSWWLPITVVIGFLIKFMFFHKGLIAEYNTTNLFLLLLILICVPKMLFALFSFIPKVGTYLGIAVSAGIIWIVLWGITFGFCELTVREIVYESEDVPESFDGYRIAQFSDAHTGVFSGPYQSLLRETVDTINSLHADLICFVGDIENFSPEELKAHKNSYSLLEAKDGVMTIMGNHDYSSYIKVSDRERAALVAETRQVQRDFGWDLLENENRFIHREWTDTSGITHRDSIAIVGEENWGKPPFPQHGNLKKALKGMEDIKDSIFTIMLSHDPNAWHMHILPVFRPNITLAGHTHGTQFSIFGWSPSSMVYKEWGGVYYDNNDMLSVSTGMGGNFPFRFNMPREVVLITLKHKK